MIQNLTSSESLLKERKKEIDFFFNHVKEQEETRNREVTKITKASMIMILYNTIEAVNREIVSEIHEELQKHEFESLAPVVRNGIINNFKKIKYYDPKAQKKKVEGIKNINDIHNYLKSCQEYFGSNIDNESVKSFYEKNFGIQLRFKDRGESIKNIKRTRNNLSHGEQSFADVGQSYSKEEIEEFINQTIEFLECCIKETADFLNKKSFLIEGVIHD